MAGGDGQVPLATGQEHVGGGDWMAAAGYRFGRDDTSVSWRGWLMVGTPATFDIETQSDGPVWIFIDDERAIDGYAPAADGVRRHTRHLTAGLHQLQVDLAGASRLDVAGVALAARSSSDSSPARTAPAMSPA